MIRLIRWEAAKLRGSLALLFALVVPGLTALLVMFAMLANDRAPAWSSMMGGFVLPLWAMFLLPMVIATFCTLVAQVEHRAKSWDHVLTQPFPRWQVFAAKLVIICTAVAGMTFLVFAYAYLVGWLGGLATGYTPVGSFGFVEVAQASVRLLGAAALVVAIQAWIALRYANFVIPLAVGIAGTMVGLAVMLTGTDQADWFPWVITLRSVGPDAPLDPVWMGLAGGLVACCLLLVDLPRRAFR
ncbi:ABC transporter permease [Paraurantiacibacter namhicola]|uniref:ABC-2 family transporter protein n=1 Tax=Paraurantiacibacter namhicola TaxID=645517 RepID=A0A1C7DB59_9SPHN|nr:ABC transporter permease [Paraurantiacibacter namhicola]ANU08612.1 ABC-2 family transporter protein [Paraurantiacibacter namhicola]